jgi:DNA-binding CsgD family transcriptional regulator
VNELDMQLGLLLAEDSKTLRANSKLLLKLKRHLNSVLDVVYYCVSNTDLETKSMLASQLGQDNCSLAFITGELIDTAVDAYKSVYPDGRALELYFENPLRPIDAKIADLLSLREQDVLALIIKGDPNKIIAHKLNVCESTVKAHVSSILKKLGARSRAYLVARLRA